VEIGIEAEQFPEKEYINRIFVAVHTLHISVPWIIVNLHIPLPIILVVYVFRPVFDKSLGILKIPQSKFVKLFSFK
jgi:hypothetical protein